MRVDIGQAEISLYSYGRLGEYVNRNKSIPASSYIIDVSGLRDPYSNRGFNKKYKDGRPGEVQSFVKEDDRYKAILDTVRMIAFMHRRSPAADSKWLSFAFRDHHGRWTAPAIAESIADTLSEVDGYKTSVYHFDLGD